MRKLILTQNVSLDGSPEFLTEWFTAQGQTGMDESDHIAELRRQDSTADALLVGRRTFLDFRGYWRDVQGDTSGISDYLNSVAKYVVSSTLTEPEWRHTTVVDGDPVAAVRQLKERDGQDIVCTGSISLSHILLGAGLVDELRLFTYPAVQGRGRRLFPDGYEVERLRLLDVMSFRRGVVLTRYAVATS